MKEKCEKFVVKTISMKKKHAEWIKQNAINISRFVQFKIDKEIKKDKIREDMTAADKKWREILAQGRKSN